MGETHRESVPVEDGDVPVWVAAPDDDRERAPGLVIVPSIFGPADDLLEQARSLSDIAVTAVLDPFWRQGGGALPYDDVDGALARLGTFDRSRCRDDIDAVGQWVATRTNGSVVGLGICFGGPWALLGAAKGLFCAAATWHGSRMEGVLDRLDGLRAPLRLHFGEIDPITPPEVVAAIRSAFAGHDDCRIVVHAGCDHGFSHAGRSWNAEASGEALDDLRELLFGFAS